MSSKYHAHIAAFLSTTFILLAIQVVCAGQAEAQLSFTAPATDTSVASCDDFFTTVWGSPLDMTQVSNTYSDKKHRFGNALQNINLLINGVEPVESGYYSSLSYSSGILTGVTNGNDPRLKLLTPASGNSETSLLQITDFNTTRYGSDGVLNPSSYNLLTVRMNVDQEATISARWDKEPGSGAAFSSTVDVYPGWATYQIDLASQSSSPSYTDGNNHGIALFGPSNAVGATAQFDWIQLTPGTSTCADATVQYSDNTGTATSVFVDDNTNPFDGVYARSAPVDADGSTKNSTFDASLFWPGVSYNVIGFSSPDYATHYMDPWDMDSSGDIVSSANVDLSSVSFSGGTMTFTTGGSDPSFRFANPNGSTIDGTIFDQFSINVSGLTNGDAIAVFFADTNGTVQGVRLDTFTGDGVYTFDLSAPPTGGETGTYPSQAGFIRFDLGTRSGVTGSVQWASLGTATTTTEPTISTPTIITAGGNLSFTSREVAPVIMPDRRGGVDFFANNGRPVNNSDVNETVQAFNLGTTTIVPGGSYTDSGGNTRTSSYINTSNSSTGDEEPDGDPQLFFVLRNNDFNISSNTPDIACTRMNLDTLGVNDDHTVLRFGWEVNSSSGIIGYTSDDIVLASNRTAEYCADMNNLPIEQGSATITGDFWGDEDVRSFRVDPHEIGDSTVGIIVEEVTLSYYHRADQQFAIVVGGDRTAAVDIYKNTSESTSGGTLIGNLSANRNSDVFLWDTSSETDGTKYWIYTTVGTRSYLSQGPVVIDHSVSNLANEAPVLTMRAPSTDGSGVYSSTTGLDLAFDVIDNVRVAVVEVAINGTLQKTIIPTGFHLAAFQANSDKPGANRSYHQEALDISNLSDGSHTLTVTAYDTAGNTDVENITFTKASSNTTAFFDPGSPNEAAQEVDVSPPADFGDGVSIGSITLTKPNTITVECDGLDPGTATLFVGASKKKVSRQGVTVATTTVTGSSATFVISNVPKLKVKKKKGQNKKKAKNKKTVYFGCSQGGNLASKKFVAAKVQKVSDVAIQKKKNKWIQAIKNTGSVQ